jgi:ribonuclease D
MDSVDLPRSTLISRPQSLRKLTDTLAQESILAVDTESNSLYAYRERVCLIQFSTTERDYLVDPLAIDDLSPLASIFASKRIEKIFHAAEYDIIMLKRDFNFRFMNLFDTMLAARILGW